MLSRRSLFLSFLAVPGIARADVLVHRFGRWYRIPDPDEDDDGGLYDDRGEPSRIRRPPAASTPAAPETDEERTVAEPDRSEADHAEDERRARASRSPIAREVVAFDGYAPGTVVVSTARRRLHLVLDDGRTALCWGVGVGREGFSWKGTETISAKRRWPDWTPPQEMLARDPKLPTHMAGGLDNPLGARALYLGDTLYRIHGTNQPSSIGRSVSSGCIRLANADIVDLFDRVSVGTTVVVL